jgi:RNA polymerase primary sigma factor
MEKMSDTSRAFLLMNIVEDNDKESLKLLSESFLDAIVQWVEPYRNKGILVSDLIQEGNLSMMAYMNSKRWLNHADWKEKIKEGTTNDLLNVLKLIEDNLKDEVVGSIQMIIDEQMDSDKISNKVLNKVNLVYDWAKRLKTELGRKPKVQELADRMGISADNIREAIQLSAEAIEDIDMK